MVLVPDGGCEINFLGRHDSVFEISFKFEIQIDFNRGAINILNIKVLPLLITKYKI